MLCVENAKLQHILHNFFPQVAEDFEELWNMPHCIGAMDGKHINIECTDNSGSLDHNYKKVFSKSMLAISDANYRCSFSVAKLLQCVGCTLVLGNEF